MDIVNELQNILQSKVDNGKDLNLEELILYLVPYYDEIKELEKDGRKERLILHAKRLIAYNNKEIALSKARKRGYSNLNSDDRLRVARNLDKYYKTSLSMAIHQNKMIQRIKECYFTTNSNSSYLGLEEQMILLQDFSASCIAFNVSGMELIRKKPYDLEVGNKLKDLNSYKGAQTANKESKQMYKKINYVPARH